MNLRSVSSPIMSPTSPSVLVPGWLTQLHGAGAGWLHTQPAGCTRAGARAYAKLLLLNKQLESPDAQTATHMQMQGTQQGSEKCIPAAQELPTHSSRL